MRKYYSLYGRLLSKDALYAAYLQVKRAKGAAGIDGQNLSDFTDKLETELEHLLEELKSKCYQPQPVRRVMIPKEGGGERALGIPTVRDRIVQQALRTILEPIYENGFHTSSYGYRPGRSCHHAINKASMFIRQYDRQWVVDMDLSKCFDTLNHDLIVATFKEKVTDSSILNLLRSFLTSGVMIGEEYVPTTLGSPQGGVISPLIANVYLNRFDHFMKAREHRIIRYADDILILCTSKLSAENAQQVAQTYLEEELKLKVNSEKTHIAHSDDGIKFLGVEVYTNYTRIQEKKLKSFKFKVKQITKRNTDSNLAKVIGKLNGLLRGFVNFFRVANCKRELVKLMGWVRRRLRCIQLRQWKKPSKLHRVLKQRGYKPPFKLIKMQSWRNSCSPLASHAMPNSWFHNELKLVDMSLVKTGISVSML